MRWCHFDPHHSARPERVRFDGELLFSDHFAVEGRLTSSWETHSSNDADAKQLFYGAGIKLDWGNRKLQPFVHALLGGVHMFPQTAFARMDLRLNSAAACRKD